MQGHNSVSFSTVVYRALGVTPYTPYGVVDSARIFCVDDLIPVLSAESELTVDGGIPDSAMERVLSSLLSEEKMTTLTSGQGTKNLSDLMPNRRRALYMSSSIVSSIKAEKEQKVRFIQEQKVDKKNAKDLKKIEKKSAADTKQLEMKEKQGIKETLKRVKQVEHEASKEFDVDEVALKAARRKEGDVSRASRAAARNT